MTPDNDALANTAIYGRIDYGLDPITGILESGHLWMTFVIARVETRALDHVDFEFNRIGGDFSYGSLGARTANKDFVISIDRVSEQVPIVATLRRWNGSAYVTPLFPDLPQDARPDGAQVKSIKEVELDVPVTVLRIDVDLTIELPDLQPSELFNNVSTVTVRTRSSQSFLAKPMVLRLAPFSSTSSTELVAGLPSASIQWYGRR